jgi:hypothetical protein
VFQTEDGCSEESSSDEKELEEPMSITSQESSSHEIESDSKQKTAFNNDFSTLSPLSSCQTLTPTDLSDSTTSKIASPTDRSTQLHSFHSEIPPVINSQQSSFREKENVSAPSVSEQHIKDTYSSHKCDANSVVEEREKYSIQEFDQQSGQRTKDSSEDLNSVHLLKDHTEELDLHSSLPTSSSSRSLQEDLCESQSSYKDVLHDFTIHHSSHNTTLERQNESNGIHSTLTRIQTAEFNSSEDITEGKETGVHCENDGTSSVSNESIIKIQDTIKPLKSKKSGKQANVKHKTYKGKEEKQKTLKSSLANCNADTNLERICKKKEGHARNGPDDNVIIRDCRAETHSSSSVNSIPSKIVTEVMTCTEKEASNSSHKNRRDVSSTLLNGHDKCQISNRDSNSVIEMDGNEKKSTSAIEKPITSEESLQSGKSSHFNGTGKHDLFPEFKSTFEEPPTRPARKEKRKSSPIHVLSPNQNSADVLTKSSITDKQLQLPAISLRPDIPKIEHKCLHEVSLTPQLKGRADILESITTALTTEPPSTKAFEVTVHKENPAFQEAECSAKIMQSSESLKAHKDPTCIAESASVVQCLCSVATEKLLDPLEDMSDQATAASVSEEYEADMNKKKYHHEKLKQSESMHSQKETYDIDEEKNKVALKEHHFGEFAQSTEFQDEVWPPVPPPRGKKLHVSKHKLTQHSQIPRLDLEGGNATDESLSDSTASSTTHESEESVIELLSSTHTSPDDRPKQDISSDEEEEIIFRAKMARRKTEDIKSVPPDKPNLYAPSISGLCFQDSSKTSCEHKLTTSKISSKPCTGNISLKCSEIYADGLSEVIISEAISESLKKQMCLPITEAVTRWLRSQSPEVLSLPLPADETDSEGSSEEQDSEEGIAEGTENQQLAGQKNVFCNPLPVLLLEDCHCLSCNSDITHSGYNGTGRRVALKDFQYCKLQNENIVSGKYDNNIIAVSVSIEGDQRLINKYDDKNCISSHKDSCVSLIPKTNTDHEEDKRQGQIKKSLNEESVLTQFSETVTNVINYSNKQVSSSNYICEKISNGFNHKNDGMNVLKSRLKNEISFSQNTSQDICAKSGENEVHEKELKSSNIGEDRVKNCKLNLLKDDDDCSFTSEETIECEWDLWDCNPAKLLPVLPTPKNQTPVEEILTEIPDDYCSHMCDPTVSVAKYYSLGTLEKKCVKHDDDDDDDDDDDELSSNATDGADEEVDALKHFQHEMEDDDGLRIAPMLQDGTGNSNKKSDEECKRNEMYVNPEIYKGHYMESDPVKNSGIPFQEENKRSKNVHNTTLLQRTQTAHLFHRKSSVLVSKLKGDGPFPCGGICCILQ